MKPLLIVAAIAGLLLGLFWRKQSAAPGTPTGLTSTNVAQITQVEALESDPGKARAMQTTTEEPAVTSNSIQSIADGSVRFIFVDIYSNWPVPNVSLHSASDAAVGGKGERSWIPRNAARWTSDSSGEITLPSHELPPIAFEVHAPGFRPAWITGLEKTGEDDRTVTVNLVESSEWSGVLQGIPHGISSSITMHASVTAEELQRLGEPVQHLEFDSLEWQCPVALDGTYSIPDIPSGVRLYCWVEREGALLGNLGTVILLLPGENRITEWNFPLASAVAGQYLDLDGHPMVNAEIWAMTPWPENSGSRFTRGKKKIATTRTDTEGRFRFKSIQARSVVITPSYEHMLQGLWPVELDLPTHESVLLQPLAKGWASGVVLSNGIPAPDARVYHDKEEHVTCDAQGRFKIPVYGDHIVTLKATSPGPAIREVGRAPVMAKAGDRGITIHLEKYNAVHLTSFNPAGEAIASWMTWFSCADLAAYSRTPTAIPRMSISNVTPGDYVAWAETANGLIAISPIQTAHWGDLERSISLIPAPGAEVIVEGPALTPWPGIRILRDGIPIGTKQASKAQPNFWLPPGTYEFQLLHNDQGQELTPSKITLETGSTSIVRLR